MLEILGALRVLIGLRIIRFEWKVILNVIRLYKKITKKDTSIKFKHYICKKASEGKHYLDAFKYETKSGSYTNEELDLVNKIIIKPMTEVFDLMLSCTC